MNTTSASLRLRARMRAAALAALCVVPVTSSAQVWTGAASHLWNDPANWEGGVLPVSSPTTALLFNTSNRPGPVNNLGDPFVLHALLFGSQAPTYQISGSPIVFTGNAQLVQNSASEQFLQNPILVNATMTIGGNGTGAVTLAGGLAGPEWITKSGAFDLRLQGASPAYLGMTQVNAGRIVIAHALALEKSTVLLNVNNALTFATPSATLGGIAGPGNFSFGSTNLTVGANNLTTSFAGSISNSGVSSFTKVGTGLLTLTGNSTYGGTTFVVDGTLAVDHGGSFGNAAHPVYIGGDGVNHGEGVLLVDRPNSRATASAFHVEAQSAIVLQNGGTLAGPAGQHPSLVLHGEFEGYGTFNATLHPTSRVTATAPLTLHLPGAGVGHLTARGTTLTVHAPAPLQMQARAILDTTTELATIVAPNGFTLLPGGQLLGNGLIRGPFIDQTAGAGIPALPAQDFVLPTVDVGAEQWTFSNLLPRINQVTIGGGTVNTRGVPLAFGVGLIGHGTIVAPVTNSLPGGISVGGPSTIALFGDLTIGTETPLSPQDGNHFEQTTINVGAHRFTPVGNTTIINSTVSLGGGTFHAPQIAENALSTTSFSGFGILVTHSNLGNVAPTAPVALGALASASDLLVRDSWLTQLISNAPVPVANGELRGGQVVSKAGFAFNGPTGFSGYGVVDGPVTGSLATPLIATNSLAVFDGIIRSNTAHFLSTTPTLWDSAGALVDLPTFPAAGTTLHAPAGLILGHPGTGGPLAIHAPTVSFANPVVNYKSVSTTIHGDVHFGAAEVVAFPHLQVMGAATMNGAVLHDISTWWLHRPVTGNGFVYGSIGQGHRFEPQGSAPAGFSFQSVTNGVYIVSGTPYTINWTDEAGYFQVRGRYAATNGLTVQGTNFQFPVQGGVHGAFRARVVDVTGDPNNRHQVILGDTPLADAVEIQDLRVADASVVFYSTTPIKIGTLQLNPFSELRSDQAIALTGLARVFGGAGSGARVDAPLTGSGFLDLSNGVHSFVSLDLAGTEMDSADVTLTGLPGGAPALLPRTNFIDRISFTAPQGALLRAGSTMEVEESSVRGKLIVDGTISGPQFDGLQIYGALSGSGVIDTGTRLLGPGAQLNPGPIGAPGLLTLGHLNVSLDPNNIPAGRGEFVFELGSAQSDRLLVTRDLSLGGTLSISLLVGLTLGPDLTFPIIDVQGTLSGTFAGLDEGDPVATFHGWNLHVTYTGGTGNDIILYTIPEPTAAIYLAGLGALFLARRRRASQSLTSE